ncbi:MAG TPA: tetratricopeptide repeat protein [Thermoanaerobaculia bacterium]|nr:tetratricopeptide repeat protein [Thermoanaerobaculia bacterium]
MSFFPRKSTLAATLTAAALLLPALPAAAQSWAGKGRLQGEVKTADGKPVAGAKVTLRKGDGPVDPKADGPKPVMTNDRGKWSVLGLTQGAWGVLIEKEGLETSEGQVQVNEFGINPPVRVTLAAGAAPAPAAAAQQQPAAPNAADQWGEQAAASIDRGNTLLQQEKFAEARAEYEKALAGLEPANHPPVLRGIARTYYQEKKADQAIAILKKALEIKPDDLESLRLISNLLVAEGREQEAQTYMARLPQGESVDPATLLNVGIKAYNEGKLQDALAQFDRVAKENPNLADAFYYRGLAHLGLNKSAEAKADFQKALELDPRHPKAAEIKDFIASL